MHKVPKSLTDDDGHHGHGHDDDDHARGDNDRGKDVHILFHNNTRLLQGPAKLPGQ